MATNEQLIPVPGRLHSLAAEGHVAGADEIYDDDLQRLQSDINADVKVMEASGTNHSKGLVPDPGAIAGTSKFLREDGTWAGVTVAPEKMGFGVGTCSTAASTAAKEVAITNFVRTKNGHVSIKFQNANTANAATLNINSTGAKPIYMNGSYVNPGEIKAGMTANMVYDGSVYQIVSLLGLEPGGTDSHLYVDMGLPSGILWAKKNIDVTQANGFAASEYQYECSFFSWGNIDGHNPTNGSFSPYTFGTSNSTEPYISSEGATIGASSIGPSHDAARSILGAPWRIPDLDNFNELFNSEYTKFIDANGDDIPSDQTNKLITMNSIVGIRLKSKTNGNIIFIPCTGQVNNGDSLGNVGNFAYYWTRSNYSSERACRTGITKNNIGPATSYRYLGIPIRPVI